ncbi:Slp family lipoprotein [Alkalilimnicola sp. S0819]|uniref:Slp family lipoprotein n=1 Tax=Alkalilimnicola sp. S0819 TaxID=2613922 RepID=UPI00126235E8|nr:Slp family lipoprotein [Alkalilimnicola sp. S0819]KAB7628326.1 hypothetical protein F3N43_01050 [Alkalilimnicola sp. S0819]MPQ15224.1 hypothetical protein [Alkalilimnicola sp. S0819]
MRLGILLGLGLLLAGCAGRAPLPTEGVVSALTPAAAVAEPVRWQGRRLLWGGRIVRAENLAQYTELELLAYPLGDNQRPQLDRASQGRVLLRWPGYLETADYPQGHLLTVLGELDGVMAGRIGQREYRFPVVRAERLHRWPPGAAAAPPRVTFGIGIMLGR